MTGRGNARFEKAADLYKNGLLIYFDGDYGWKEENKWVKTKP